MREIKFRVWDITNKKMILEPYLHFVDGKSFYIWKGGELPRSDLEFALMQYTGVLDAKDVEICEGDLLKLKNGKIAEVAYSNNFGGFRYYTVGGEDAEQLNDCLPFGYVVGNVYENNVYQNPKLLKSLK